MLEILVELGDQRCHFGLGPLGVAARVLASVAARVLASVAIVVLHLVPDVRLRVVSCCSSKFARLVSSCFVSKCG